MFLRCCDRCESPHHAMTTAALRRGTMTRAKLLIIAAACTAVLSALALDVRPVAGREPMIGCAPTDASTDALREWVVGIATGTDSVSAGCRQDFGIPVLPDT